MKDNNVNCDEIAPSFEVALSRISFSTLAEPVVFNGIRVLSSSKQMSVNSKQDEIGSRMNIRGIIPLAIDSLLGYIQFLFPLVFKKKEEPVSTCKEKMNIVLVASSSSLIKKLPQAILLEVMTFLYDDLPSIQSMLCSSKVLLMAFSHRDIIINHIRQVIMNSTTTPFCTLCSNPVTYPHQLKDCNHVACGRCIWQATGDSNTVFMSSNCKNAKCKTKIRSRPLRVSTEQNRLANVRAFWLLNQNGNKARFRRNDKRIRRGTRCYFGKNGIQHERGAFSGKGFPGDFDGMETIRFADIDHKLSTPDEWDVCRCPADRNYSGFPMGTATNLTAIIRGIDKEDVIILQRWNRNFGHSDDYEIEEEYLLIR